METLLLTKRQIPKAAQVIKNGGVVAVRTETVWGLATLPENAKKVYDAKNRPADKNLVLQFPSLEQVSQRFELSLVQRRLFKKFRGGITIALSDNTAVRIPCDPIMRKFLRVCAKICGGSPLVVTSANISGQAPATTWQGVNETLGGRIDAIIVSSPCKIGQPSTIVKIDKNLIKFIRIGAVSEKRILTSIDKYDTVIE
ncbi:MAG: L-threonylcarbamoyladenylate synthase [Christensenellaceae bacterium]|nr:L-threonylcarbamoyladenylate synthase [Christensenellaceae bacterium]